MSDTPQLARKLNLFDATMIVVSGIIGSGIFINPYVVAQKVGTPFLILGVWIAGGLIALCGAFVFAELSTVMPRAGGQYAFFREAFHPLFGFLHGWALLFIIQSGATAAVAMACGQYVARLAHLPAGTETPLAVAIMLSLVVFHATGIKPGAVLVNLITFGKTLAIAALVVGAFVLAKGSGIHFDPLVPPSLHHPGALISAFLAGLVPAMFAYGGWQNANFVAEEVRDPLRNLPRATLIGVFIVIAVYVSANIAYVHVLGAPALAATRTPAADLAARLVGEQGAGVISVLVIVSTFGFLNLALMTAPRVYYAMARDGLFFSAVARVSPRSHVPVMAIVLQGVLASAFALSNTYDQLLGYAVFADWIFFAMAGAALIVFRHTLPGAPRPYPTPLYPYVPVLFIVAGAGIVLNTFVTDTRNALIGSAILALGVPVFFLWRRRGAVASTLLLLFVAGWAGCARPPSPAARVREEFLHSWRAYQRYAWGHDELRSLSKTPHDWYQGTLLITAVDSLDTLIIMGLTEEAERTRVYIDDHLSFDQDISVKNFEITIRVLGGLLSSYQMTRDPRLLALADDLGRRLLPVFGSPTGMPYQFVNLRTGATRGAESNPAEIGTLLLELGTLSRLTGNPVYYDKAKRALVELYARRSRLGLVGETINVDTGVWISTASHAGGGIDSYYEYLLKAWLLFGDEDCRAMWESSRDALNRWVADEVGGELWYGSVDMTSGARTGTQFGALEAFLPAVLALDGDIGRARRLQASSFAMWTRSGIEPDGYDYRAAKVTSAAYPLRPEIIESAYYLHALTGDKQYLDMGHRFLDDLVACCRTEAGYATLKSVITREQGDSMPSFFLAETLKYLYLLFSPPETLDLKGVVFNTEAHPLRRTW